MSFTQHSESHVDPRNARTRRIVLAYHCHTHMDPVDRHSGHPQAVPHVAFIQDMSADQHDGSRPTVVAKAGSD